MKALVAEEEEVDRRRLLFSLQHVPLVVPGLRHLREDGLSEGLRRDVECLEQLKEGCVYLWDQAQQGDGDGQGGKALSS